MTGPIVVIGGNGRTGRHIVERLRASTHPVRVLSRHAGDLDADIVVGSITARDDVHRAVGDAAGVVIVVESSERPGPNGPEAVHGHGVENVIAAAPPAAHIVLVTQIYITRPEAFESVRAVILARRRGEEALRASGRPYTIVRPSWLTDEPGGKQAIRFAQGDSGDGQIARADVAAVVVAALTSADARGKTFEIYNEPGAPPTSWDLAFARLAEDPIDPGHGRQRHPPMPAHAASPDP
jgi:uncharacterized protein YbjT (DUF2867 family)